MTHVAITTATVPDIWYKTQRLIRTIIAALVVLVPLANTLALVVVGYLQSQTDLVVPPWAFVVLNGVIAVTAFIMGLVARIMAIPAVNVWLTKLGAGSVPAQALVPGDAPGKSPKVARDPTV